MKCECKGAGYCSRHQIDMTDRMVLLCKSSEEHAAFFSDIGKSRQDSYVNITRLTVVAGFLRSIISIILSGFAKASKERIASRREICGSCRHNKIGSCQLCGCVIRFKTIFASSFCPDKRWGVEQGGQFGGIPFLSGSAKSPLSGGCGCGSKSAKPAQTLPILPMIHQEEEKP